MSARRRSAAIASVVVAAWVPALPASAVTDTPADYAWRWPLAASAAPLHRVVLPAVLYDGAAHADLRDLRVFNAAGEVVPYAFVPPAAPVMPPARHALPLFPLEVDRAHPSLDDVALRVRRSAGSTTIEVAPAAKRASPGARLAGYVADASAVEAPASALVVVADGGGNVDVRLRIEASDDLATWQTVVASAPVVRLVVAGRTLARERLPFTPRRARYFRVSSADGAPMPALSAISAETGAPPVEPRIDWRELQGAVDRDVAGAFVYDAGAALPATRLDLALPATNTVLPLSVQARARPDDEWRAVASGVVYRLGDTPGELRSPPLALSGLPLRYWRIVADDRAGVSAAPRLSLGWMPPEIVFAARGAAPFELAYGRRDASPGALPLATLVPQGTGATLVAAVDVAPLAAPLRGNVAALDAKVPVARIALWATLVIAALLLVALGVRLLRRAGADDAPPPGAPPA
jgi:hypothetical protein